MAKQGVLVFLLVMGLALLAVVLVQIATDAQPDYADLDPAPDTVVWQEGHETTLWLSTNRNWVDMRIDSVSLGLGDIRRAFPESGGTLELGRGEGCLQWAVSSLSVASIGDVSGGGKSIQIQGEVDRNGTTGVLTVNIRLYAEGTTPGNPLTTTVSSNSSAFTHGRRVTPITGTNMWVIEASKDDQFPQAATRSIVVPIDDIATAITIKDEGAEDIRILRDRGVGIIACGPVDDVVVTLHGREGKELNRYLVDVHAASTPVPSTPSPGAEYISRRVCVDAVDAQDSYLSGGELVGAVVDLDDFTGLAQVDSIVITDTTQENHYKYFFSYSVGSSLQLSVTDAGASALGLDADRVYAIRLTATDLETGTADNPATPDVNESVPDDTRSIDVGVWLDISTLSPNDNGECS